MSSKTSDKAATAEDGLEAWMKSLGFELTFDTGLKSYYNKKMQRVINAEAAEFFYQAQEAAVAAALTALLSKKDYYLWSHATGQDTVEAVSIDIIQAALQPRKKMGGV